MARLLLGGDALCLVRGALVGQYSPKGLSVSASAEAVVDLSRFEDALERVYDEADSEDQSA